MARVFAFDELQADLAAKWRTMVIAPARIVVVDKICRRLLEHKAEALELESKTTVKAAIILALHERESGGNFKAHMHNGDPLTARTVHVPKGRLPAPAQPPFSFVQSAVDALAIDGLDKVAALPGGWMVERALYSIERYNGFGYRSRGLVSPYVWSWTNQYRSGKFIEDGVLDRTFVDQQVGCAAMLSRLAALDPDMNFWKGTPHVIDGAHPLLARPMAEPMAPDAVQRALNALEHVEPYASAMAERLKEIGAEFPLDTDGLVGRRTKAAIRGFQAAANLLDDGIAGVATSARIAAAVGSVKKLP